MMANKEEVKVVVICYDRTKDRIRIIPVTVLCTEEERQDTDHYHAAKLFVRDRLGIKPPYITYDEDDAWFPAFDFVDTVNVDGVPIEDPERGKIHDRSTIPA